MTDFRITSQERKQATQLYAQQMWLWGRDIRYPEGNLLKDYGFSYRRDVETLQQDAKKYGSSQYGYIWEHNGKTVEMSLWSFGLTIACEHANVLLERNRFRPQWLSQKVAAHLYSNRDFPESESPPDSASRHCTGELLTALVHRITDYERWVTSTVPADWRVKEARVSPDRFRIPVEEMQSAWEALGEQWAKRLNAMPEPLRLRGYKKREKKYVAVGRAESVGLFL